ncbi:MAG TPA: tetratricopeptide repeat protein [Terriglobales bacterium]|nr:tetratricopeptide repeat protein [Terriglobales bacterium]
MLKRVSVALVQCAVAASLAIQLSAQQQDWQSLSARTASLYREGQYSQALPRAQQALQLAQATWGAEHANVATSLHNLGDVERALGKYSEAESAYRQELAICNKLFGTESARVAGALNDLAVLYQDQNDYSKSEPYCQQSLRIRKKVLGPDHPDVAQSLTNLAAVYQSQQKYTEAEELFRRGIQIQEKAGGPENPHLFAPLVNLAHSYVLQENYLEAEALYRRALSIQVKAFGENRPEVVMVLNALAWLCNQNGKDADAEHFLQNSLAVTEKNRGADSAEVATVLSNLAALYVQQGLKHAEMYAQAEPLLQRAVSIREKLRGQPDLAHTIEALATCYQKEGKYSEADALRRRVLNAGEQKGRNNSSPSTSEDLMKLATVDQAEGKYAEAESLIKQAMEIEKRNGRSESSTYASLSNNLAETYREQGKYADAEQLYLTAIRIDEKASGADSGELASPLNNLGLLYSQEGRYAEAEPLHWRALTVVTKAYGRDDLKVAITLNCLASLYMAEDRYDEAEPLIRRSLEIRQKLLRPDHPDIGTAMNNLAVIYRAKGEYAKAEPMQQQALAIDQKALGSEHPVVAIDLKNLARLNTAQGKYAVAESLLTQALNIQQKSLGPSHPDVAETSIELAKLYSSQNDYLRAEPLFKQAFANLSRQFQYHFTYMSEQDRLTFLDTVEQYFPVYFNFCLKYRTQDPSLAAEIYDLVLWEKGMVAGSITSLRRQIAASGDKETLQLLDQITARRAEVARLQAASRGGSASSRVESDRLEAEADQLERELVKRSGAAAERSRMANVTWRDVQKALGPGEAAIEFVRFINDGATVYVALIVTPGAMSVPALVPVGAPNDLENAALQDYWPRVGSRAPSLGSGVRFYQTLWKPLEPKLAGAKRVYIAPDGLLNQISLAAVPTEDGRLLIEKYDVRTINSTKDVLRKSTPITPRAAVLIGDPQFDLTVDQARAVVAAHGKNDSRAQLVATSSPAPSAAASDAPRITRSREQGDGMLNRLPGTALEVQSVGNVLASGGWRVETFLGQDAVEEAIKSVNGPRLLHVATHGFFEPDQRQAGGGKAGNAMLRSGLFFAGANRVLSGAAPAANVDDGILTAYEATGINLHGTELVVLSACETGRGESANGEGVFGLRRALQEAGAQAVMMSMWKVPDSETQQLMTLFYKKWLSGKDKHTALREAQLELRKDIMDRWQEDRPHDWAAFVLVGD